jgi:HlyD family secretion protein
MDAMKRLIFWIIVLGILVGLGAAGYNKFHPRPLTAESYNTAKVERGDIPFEVKSSGTVQPIQSVQIGSFVSGPIRKIYKDFNDVVKEGDRLAEVDPLIPKAQCSQAQASLDCANANLLQTEAKLKQAERDWKRAEKLFPQKALADSDYDVAVSTYEAAKAAVAVCKATIKQCEASLELAKVNLGYTIIKSPVDGIITDRKVDSGQTVASQFQTPVLYVVAPELDKRVNVLASVDEADIGLIREAHKRGEPVTFEVDAYPKDTFHGKIAQVRLTPTTVQNVVTYTVVVEAPNTELKLLPGMTATISFQIEKHEKVLKIPNAAFRFHPKPEQVCERDRKLLEGKAGDEKKDIEKKSENDSSKEADKTATDKNPLHKSRRVWILDGDLLSAVDIVAGIGDKTSTELVSGDLKEGQLLATGVKTP